MILIYASEQSFDQVIFTLGTRLTACNFVYTRLILIVAHSFTAGSAAFVEMSIVKRSCECRS
jgi:hypothetical protein